MKVVRGTRCGPPSGDAMVQNRQGSESSRGSSRGIAKGGLHRPPGPRAHAIWFRNIKIENSRIGRHHRRGGAMKPARLSAALRVRVGGALGPRSVFAQPASAEGQVMTVVRPRLPAQFGSALPHEHVLVDFVGADKVSRDRYDANVRVRRRRFPSCAGPKASDAGRSWNARRRTLGGGTARSSLASRKPRACTSLTNTATTAPRRINTCPGTPSTRTRTSWRAGG